MTTAAFLLFAVRVIADICCRISTGYPMLFALDVVNVFVFNVGNDHGFVIVSGEDRVRPVLGYTDKGTFDPDNLPDNMRAWLANYQEQITWAADHLDTASPEISAEWSRYLSGAALRADNGVLLETANWDQGDPYNRMNLQLYS